MITQIDLMTNLKKSKNKQKLYISTQKYIRYIYDTYDIMSAIHPKKDERNLKLL
jgi:hypothetical protein